MTRHAPRSIISADGLRHYESLASQDGHPVDHAIARLPAVVRARRRLDRARHALDAVRDAPGDLLVEYQDATLAYRIETERYFYAAGFAFGASLSGVTGPSRRVVRHLVEAALMADQGNAQAVRALLAAATTLVR
jgi:hypothetical protein